MPALDNPRHERFAQALLKGATADQAYQEAGYKANRHNAAALARQKHISTRVAELQEKAAMRAEITAADITKELHRYANALASFGIASEEGAVSHQHLNTARQCLMDVAKLNGWIIERASTETTLKGNLAALSDEELNDRIKRFSAIAGDAGGEGEAEGEG